MSSARAWRMNSTASSRAIRGCWDRWSRATGCPIARQFLLPLVVWLHACIGLHFAWRLKSWYRRLAAGALRLRPARPRRRHRGRGDRLARRRRSCPAAGLPRKPVRPRARAAAGRHRQPLCHFARSPDRGARAAGRRSGRASAARLLGTTRRRRASRLRRTPQREPADRAHHPGDEPSCRHPACFGVRRTRPLLDLPGSHRRRASRQAAAALAGRTEGADEGRRAGQCAARLPAPSRRPATTA